MTTWHPIQYGNYKAQFPVDGGSFSTVSIRPINGVVVCSFICLFLRNEQKLILKV